MSPEKARCYANLINNEMKRAFLYENNRANLSFDDWYVLGQVMQAANAMASGTWKDYENQRIICDGLK
jgi:hypothetical protein